MENVREEIRVFMGVAETILNPALIRPPLSEEERNIISFYAHNVIDYLHKSTSPESK
jgi:hypothetical protein